MGQGLAPHYSQEEFARRGDDVYDREISEQLGPESAGKYVAIDIESGDFEVDPDELAASDRLLARRPTAQVWITRAGSRYARRFGPTRTFPPT